ncbi:MAG: phenylalanine--tRNA ligase beta subunit-related protein, partial [Thermoguttaceae bacterium]
VMGGWETEVSPSTRDVLVEAAEFDPVSIRTTARRLGLHSASSYRFERRVDPAGVDWASRRCCELILETAGGELAAGVVDVGRPPEARQPIVLRLGQLPRILGIRIEPERVRKILLALGNSVLPSPSGRGTHEWVPGGEGEPTLPATSVISTSTRPSGSDRVASSASRAAVSGVSSFHGLAERSSSRFSAAWRATNRSRAARHWSTSPRRTARHSVSRTASTKHDATSSTSMKAFRLMAPPASE